MKAKRNSNQNVGKGDCEEPAKRAVVVVHGMGSQSPMETLRGFVDAVWTTDECVSGKTDETWTKPDYRLSRELKRVTTPPDEHCVRTDFFEFYWAHLMHGTRLSSVLWWLKHLFLRPLSRVPKGIRVRWATGWLALITLLLALVAVIWSVLAVVAPVTADRWPFWIPLLPIVVLALLAAFTGKFVATALILVTGVLIGMVGWGVEVLADPDYWPAWTYMIGAPLVAVTLLFLFLAGASLQHFRSIGLPVLIAGSAIGVALIAAVPFLATFLISTEWSNFLPVVAAAALLLLLWILRHRFFVEMLGDAARYLTPTPENIGARQEIREAGLELIRHLHRSGEYKRIIVVGHSLGAVIAYDILTFYWSDIAKTLKHKTPDEKQALADIEDAAAKLRCDAEQRLEPGGMLDANDPALIQYRLAQRSYADAVAKAHSKSWLVTDFVTVGSPLTHAHFLLVDDGSEPFDAEERRAKESWIGRHLGMEAGAQGQSAFRRVAKLFGIRASQREFPLCPPLPDPPVEDSETSRPCEDERLFSYELPDGARVPHHAALFAAVRWTNLYAKNSSALFGDPIGGPTSPLFGPGVQDVELNGTIARTIYSHSDYWQQAGDRQHIDRLRTALDLKDRDKPRGAA